MAGRLVIGVVVLLGTIGCGSDAKDYCEKAIACEGGNDKDMDACVDSIEGESDVAEDYDCEDQFDKLLECETNNSTCQESGTSSSSSKYFTPYSSSGVSACDGAQTALTNCVKAASQRRKS